MFSLFGFWKKKSNSMTSLGDKLKNDLIHSLQELATPSFNDDYIKETLIPAINKAPLNNENDKQLILEYLGGSDKLKLNCNLIELVRNSTERALGYETSYTNREAFNNFIKPRQRFLAIVDELEKFNFYCEDDTLCQDKCSY